MGVVRTFQLTRLFIQMTVMENLLVTSRWDTEDAIKNAVDALVLVELEGMKDEKGQEPFIWTTKTTRDSKNTYDESLANTSGMSPWQV